MVWNYLKKLYIEVPYDSAIPSLGTYPEKVFMEKYSCIRVFIAALFTIAKKWKQPKCPLINGFRILVHIYNGILGENIFKQCTDKGLIPKITNHLHNPTAKMSATQWKNGKTNRIDTSP